MRFLEYNGSSKEFGGKMFEKEIRIDMHKTDAAGLIFHGRIFELTDRVYEDFLEYHGITYSSMFKDLSFMTPVVNCSANFYAPVAVGDKVLATMKIEKVGSTSCTLFFEFKTKEGKVVMDARTIHVVIDKKTMRPIPVPEKFLAMLQ